ncbi:MAG: HNH endonuclease, partial [Bifidobacteriaceae bacterium]|nr:HNH endonuclease [Bifidobacteriaceae bacterium]
FDVFVRVWKRDPGVDGMPATAGEAAAAPHVLVKIPAETLLGLSEEPGELAATGEPVPADAARRIAECATWQALVEHAGRVVGLGKKIHPPGFLGDPSMWPAEGRGSGSYKAPGWLRLVLEARGGGCSTPNCQAPPGRSDVDHIVPFDPAKPAKEQTKGSNLQFLCRACHLRKTHHGWEYVRDVETGETTITTPNGHTGKTPPPGTPELE